MWIADACHGLSPGLRSRLLGARRHSGHPPSYNTIATLLNLPERNAEKQEITITAVKTWLQKSSKWLLILDNADDLKLLPPFLPPTAGGHILITTRAWDMKRLATRLEVKTLPDEQGATLLLQRANLLPKESAQATSKDRQLAIQLTQELGGLPLALDQAGAFMEATGTGLEEYLRLYQTHRQTLLEDRRSLVEDHPDSVTTTWSLSFERIEQKNPTAAALLQFCAHLAPDAIPESIIIKGAPHLGPLLEPLATNPLLFPQAVETLRTYSLIDRDTQAQILSLHRLVQAAIRDRLSIDAEQDWKLRTILAVETACPDVQDVKQWNACEQWLPHALVCAVRIEQEQVSSTAAASLLSRAGYYLDERARYSEVEPLYEQALQIYRQVLGEEHPYTATSLGNLAVLYKKQGRYKEAEPLYEQAVQIDRKVLGEGHPDTARSVNNLAGLYADQGRYEEAEPLYVQALKIRRKMLGEEHPHTGTSLNDLAELYKEQERFVEAEPLLKQALEIRRKMLGEEHPNTAGSLNNLARLYQKLGRIEEAEPLLKRALEISRKVLGEEHRDTAGSLNNLALLYRDQRMYKEAEPLLKRALEINRKVLGEEHRDTAGSLNNLARLYEDQERYEEAGPLYKQALTICEQSLGIEHSWTQTICKSYVRLLSEVERRYRG